MPKVSVIVKLVRPNGEVDTYELIEQFSLYSSEIDEFMGALKDKVARLRNGFIESRT